MAAKKSAKKPKARARKAAKVKNLPAKPLSGKDARAVKGGDGYSKVQVDYNPQRPDGSLDAGIVFTYNVKETK